jgi:hypothetical protein
MQKRVWVISVDMGYGHQRAAYPLKDIAEERIITANRDRIISEDEERKWRFARWFYESISRMQSLPIVGRSLFRIYDWIQHIPQLHPIRDLSRPSLQALYVRRQIKHGLCKSLFEYVKAKELPVVTTFFVTAIAAEHYGVKDIYCVCTDSDINRAWAPVQSKKTRIKYCAPCREVVQRLLEYGVPEQNIALTGFPLPPENLGTDESILKHDLAVRLSLLDPKRVFLSRAEPMVHAYLGSAIRKPTRPLTIMYAIGGAGAHHEIAATIMKSLKEQLRRHELHLIISVGTHLDILMLVRRHAEVLGLVEGTHFSMVHALELRTYFEEFNQALRTTDILWTKPSELSFYAGLGIPIIAAPPLGYHEERNLCWLKEQGLGFSQEDPRFVNEWLQFWLDDGRLAEAAFEGPVKLPVAGAQNIIKLVFGKDSGRSRSRRS